MTTTSLRVNAEYMQYCLTPRDADLGEPDYTGGNGLVWVNPETGAAVVFTGVDTGDVHLDVTVTDHPPALDPDAWDEIVEVPIAITGDGFAVGGPTAIEDLDDVALPATPGQHRTYRMRVCARGRDQGRDAGYIDADDGDELVEQHHIALWPAPPAPEQRLKLTDQVGTHHRADQAADR